MDALEDFKCKEKTSNTLSAVRRLQAEEVEGCYVEKTYMCLNSPLFSASSLCSLAWNHEHKPQQRLMMRTHQCHSRHMQFPVYCDHIVVHGLTRLYFHSYLLCIYLCVLLF